MFGEEWLKIKLFSDFEKHDVTSRHNNKHILFISHFLGWTF